MRQPSIRLQNWAGRRPSVFSCLLISRRSCRAAKQTGQESFQREVKIADKVFLVTVSYAEQFNTVRRLRHRHHRAPAGRRRHTPGQTRRERTFDAVPDLIAILDTDHHLVRATGPWPRPWEKSPGNWWASSATKSCTKATCHTRSALIACCCRMAGSIPPNSVN